MVFPSLENLGGDLVEGFVPVSLERKGFGAAYEAVGRQLLL